ncbi:hypothetical protein MINT15_12030 [Saccharomonospora viridis]|uniref:Uncharacterized protein n=1 Tax=Saccharomonospora viridis TaxID=1852 RepID=A0A837DCL7_9PSEU|nr:hypothetical protein MINT15_12030 [Saccharomonospora viridis]
MPLRRGSVEIEPQSGDRRQKTSVAKGRHVRTPIGNAMSTDPKRPL